MLALIPSCENCNKSLPPESKEAMICSFECTFCKGCVNEVLNEVLKGVCPNCGGNFIIRPILPTQMLLNNPASTEVIFKPVNTKY